MRIRTGSLSMGLRALRSAPPWVTLVVCCVGQFMVILDVTIVNVALPQMRHDLSLSVSAQEWVVNAYTLAFAGFLMLGGRAADLWGRRRIFLIGIAVFTVASLTGGLAANGLWLITARAVQGLGAAMLAPAPLSLLTSRFTDPHERRKALSAWSTTSASGAAVGVLAGGILTGLLSWRWVLFVNIPVGIAVIVPALLAVSEPRVDGPRARLDILGAVTVTLGFTFFVYGIVGTDTHPWTSPQTVITLALGGVLLAAFVLAETRIVKTPLIPFSVFKRRSLTVANGVTTTIGAAIWGLQDFRGEFAYTSSSSSSPSAKEREWSPASSPRPSNSPVPSEWRPWARCSSRPSAQATPSPITRAMLWSASSSLLLAIVAVVISAQLTRTSKEPQPVATPMKVGLPRDH
jgi:MFS family permease